MNNELVKHCSPLPPSSKLLVLGAGFSGQRVASIAKAHGRSVICSRRKFTQPGADLVFDSNENILPSKKDLDGITHILSCIPPSANGEDPVLTVLLDYLKDMPLQWVGYLSTTGVYGDSNGGWVSEKDTPKPQQTRSKRRLACEKAWQATGLPVQILRLPGIYGPGRSALESVKNSNCKVIEKSQQVFSRVHVDDIAGATFHLINKAAKGHWPNIVNIADDLPTSNKEVLVYAAKLLDLSLPPAEPFAIASKRMSAMALSFWQENRRVSNNLLCNELGYSLMHPNYQSGLKTIFETTKNG